MQVNAQDALDSSLSIYFDESIKGYRFIAALVSVSFLFLFQAQQRLHPQNDFAS